MHEQLCAMALIPAGIRSALSLAGRITCLGGLLLGLGLLVETGKPARAGPPPDLAAYPWLYQRDNRPLDPAEEVVELIQDGLRAAQLLPVWAGPRPRLMTLDEAESLLARVQPSRRLSFTCDPKGCQPVDLTPSLTSGGIFWGGEIDLTGDGIPEKVRRLQEQIVIYSDGAEVWRGDADWRVADLALGDPNDDGRWEAILALWKPDETGVMRSHPFIIGYRKGIYRDIWGGSAVADPIYELELGDVDGDGTQELIVLEATDQAGQRAVTVWDWHGWGFSLRWRSDPGYYRDLVFTPAAATHPPFVGVSVRQLQHRHEIPSRPPPLAAGAGLGGD
jgi:hypothetical protein